MPRADNRDVSSRVMTVTTTNYFPRVHRVPGRTHARLRPRSAPLVAQATKRARDFSAAPFAGKKVSAPRRGGLFATDRTHIACDVCTTGKWYPRTAARVESRAPRGVGVARVKGAQKWKRRGRLARELACLPACLPTCLPACRRPSSPPETRLAACGFALPLFAESLLFFQRGACPSSPSPFILEAFLSVAPLENSTAPPSCNPSYSLRQVEVVDSAFSSQVHVYGVSWKYERWWLSIFDI